MKTVFLIAFLFILCLPARAEKTNFFENLWKMGSGQVNEAPEWASFFTAEQYHKFIASIKNYFKQQGIDIVIEDGVARAKDDTGESEDIRLGLQNIAQICKQSDEGQWDEIIKEFFDNFILSRHDDEFDKKIPNYEEVKEFLSVRIWPREYLAKLEKEVIYHEDMEGTVSALVLDLPRTVRNVKPAEAGPWGKTDTELFQTALENLKTKYPLTISQEKIADEMSITLLSRKDFFAASHILLMGQNHACVGTYGALVGVPNSQAILCYPINDALILQAINPLIFIISGMYRDGPRSVSQELYWYHDGKFQKLPYERTEDKIDFLPPEEFLEMLGKL